MVVLAHRPGQAIEVQHVGARRTWSVARCFTTHRGQRDALQPIVGGALLLGAAANAELLAVTAVARYSTATASAWRSWHRQAVVLAYGLGLRHKAVAALLGTTVSQIGHLLEHAKQALAESTHLAGYRRPARPPEARR